MLQPECPRHRKAAKNAPPFLAQFRHRYLLRHKHRREKKIGADKKSASVHSLYAYKHSLIAQNTSLFGKQNSLLIFLGNSLTSHCNYAPISPVF